jgi:hypothetical protein
MASPVFRLRQPLVRFVRWRTVAKVLSIGFDVVEPPAELPQLKRAPISFAFATKVSTPPFASPW